MSETEAKALINQERLTLYELIASQKILTATGAEALATIEAALGNSGGGSGGSVDISTLAKENTLTGITNKIPALSSGRIPVSIDSGTVTPDIRVINTAGDYTFNNYFFLYIKVKNGTNNSVVLKTTTTAGDTLETGEYINFEQIAGKKHSNIVLTILVGGSVRIIGGF